MTTAVREFTCAVCGAICLTTMTEAEVNREFLNSGIQADGSALLSACDDCYRQVMSEARDKGLLE